MNDSRGLMCPIVLVPAQPDCPGLRAIKWLLLLLFYRYKMLQLPDCNLG